MYELDKTLPDDLKNFYIPIGLGNGQYFKSCAHLMVEKNNSGGEKRMDEKVKELEEKVAGLEKLVAEKEERIKEFEAKAQSVDELKKKMKDLEEENKKLKEENKELKAKVEELEKKLKKYYPPQGKDYYPAKEELEKKDAEIKDLKEKLASLEKANEELKSELELRDAKVKELENQIREKELAERTKERVDQIISETGFEFSEDRLEKIRSEIRDLNDEEFKDYVDSMVDTVLASIPSDIVKIMKDIQDKEEGLSLAGVIQKAYEEYNKSKKKEPADLTGAKTLASLNQDQDESLLEKYKKL